MAIGVSYKEHADAANLAGRSVADARRQYRASFGIPDRARAVVNGRTVKPEYESEVYLHDCDELTFVVRGRSKMPLLVGAMLLTMAITGGIFAFTYTNATSTINVSTGTGSGSDFASVSENVTSQPTWTVRGAFKGTTGGGNLFDIDTATSGYAGDLTCTITLANADQLTEVYRVLALKLQVFDADGQQVDITGAGDPPGAPDPTTDFALLTLDSAQSNLYITGEATQFTVKVTSGFYVANIFGGGWTGGYEDPQLFAEVFQR